MPSHPVSRVPFALAMILVLSVRSDRALHRTPGFLRDVEALSREDKFEEGHAWEMFEWWHGQRVYPNEELPKSAFWEAWQARALMPVDEAADLRGAGWTSIGPDNVGGRMLCVEVDPSNANRVWAGAASGGLWRSDVAGEGVSAWDLVETGFPTVSVSAIVIDPANPANMVIGTGEGRYERGQVGTPGARASYGLGVLRSTDGGATWLATDLTWTFDQLRSVQSIRAVATDPAILWAATTHGAYRSTDGGATWTLQLDLLNVMDTAVLPTSSSTVFASVGQLGTPDNTQTGIWKSTDSGATWTKLGGGLPTTDFGRTPLAISADGLRIYAGVSNSSSRQVVGLYRSTNGGTTWTNFSAVNWASSQAWYNNAIAVSPLDATLVLAAGLDVYRTNFGSAGLSQVSAWYLGFEGNVPAGGPEGPSDYVHADSHWIAFDPSNAARIYVACDGGIFKSTDSGVSWAGKNGGLRTSQFYNGLASDAADHALGGLQDNGTLLYEGSDSWNKTFGGDGGWCAIDPSNPNTMYEEYIYLNMFKTTNNGLSWSETHAYSQGSANFIAPFVLAPSVPLVLYGGRLAVEKTTNGGNSWFFPDGDSDWNGTPVATIGVSFGNANHVVAGTGSSAIGATVEIRRSTNGGTTWNATSGAPNRYPTDFAYDPNDDDVVWAAFSGYGTGHVHRSTDAGATWTDVSGNLPDIPHQTVVVDPMNGAWAYVGTDLGVFRTVDGGASWSVFDSGMPPAMILDLVIEPTERRMRAATFGNAVWEILLPVPATSAELVAGLAAPRLALANIGANPVRGAATFRLSGRASAHVRVTVVDAAGRVVRTLLEGPRAAGTSEVTWDGRDEAGRRVGAGIYFVRANAEGETSSAKITILR